MKVNPRTRAPQSAGAGSLRRRCQASVGSRRPRSSASSPRARKASSSSRSPPLRQLRMSGVRHVSDTVIVAGQRRPGQVRAGAWPGSALLRACVVGGVSHVSDTSTYAPGLDVSRDCGDWRRDTVPASGHRARHVQAPSRKCVGLTRPLRRPRRPRRCQARAWHRHESVSARGRSLSGAHGVRRGSARPS